MAWKRLLYNRFLVAMVNPFKGQIQKCPCVQTCAFLQIVEGRSTLCHVIKLHSAMKKVIKYTVDSYDVCIQRSA